MERYRGCRRYWGSKIMLGVGGVGDVGGVRVYDV